MPGGTIISFFGLFFLFGLLLLAVLVVADGFLDDGDGGRADDLLAVGAVAFEAAVFDALADHDSCDGADDFILLDDGGD